MIQKIQVQKGEDEERMADGSYLKR
uniref:Uncharacterized protein n=1 Tax=Arundo donax TaxID=35708 RepID=A0A0A9F3Q3_ARUDO